MALSLTVLAIVLLLTSAWRGFQVYVKKERLPNVDFLRISQKPGGKAGDADDVKAFLSDSLSAIMKGYNEYSKKGKHFLLRTPRQVYFIAAPRCLEEIRKISDNQLSQPAAAITIFQIKHNFHEALENDSYHFNVVRGKMRQALGFHLDSLTEESRHAFDVEIGGREGEWNELNVWNVTCKIVTRMVNRMLVGEPLCRNEEYLQFSCDIAPSVFDTALRIRNYPDFMKTIMMYFMTERKRQQALANKHLLPIIKQRMAMLRDPAAKQKTDRPNDTIQWLLDMTPPEKMDPEILLHRLVHINVNAIHAPAYTITECIFDLCRHPEIHEELRTEISEVLGLHREGGGWSKENIDRLLKLDSFIRESSRLTPMSAIKMERYAVRDTVLSDGTMIPKGTSIGVISHGRHMDDDICPNATTWDPFRYARLREGRNPADIENTFAEASPDNMLFGLGRHACPGRHFASAVCKIFLVTTLARYDIKFLEGKPLPEGHWTQKFRHPDVKATIGWKRRPMEKRFAGLMD
ncbi:uncharacterized protein A1O5_04793 [Cladophialophora psammophila CBS 110553]|uniref:Cytochrome P450 n=1 Tax=Cladophialophora psammophila CBS 110553 TaxID=1182543 RepID=W9XPM8_9EURO|nr:uncharacterized protein A1O5_04793 [Cladophialophora psammophila CBS 110553]EXJ72289.1 hypothetical protein A1O5_04793 [Cladophialophora psammophila CBS 110553]